MAKRPPYQSPLSDPMPAKRQRLAKYMSDPRNWVQSNRFIAAVCDVSEKMVRRYKAIKGIPALEQCTGKVISRTPPTVRGRKQKK